MYYNEPSGYGYQNVSHGHHGHHGLMHRVLMETEPVVRHGLMEAQHTSVMHAMREVAAMSYLMGMGYCYADARRMVESWECNETFPQGR
ncbi:hypothetical protein QR721_03675 [Aciduricibacillus chroicocephali]|uniref:Uncharacterized protein n=1 Tax=Aciduricibacillus chroicocephali TaxID=3054939 RepID=A0ABY9KXG7_9BACI|nr:hypothetical protein QR721_03675 [Bacillaceae bacterium 44XB]